ncbi:MAG TPA: hypothetical protein VFP61_02420 [Acidimicrobiales bacterium]|nr:hypothetical protein [Acidimicrobiales bacterium]
METVTTTTGPPSPPSTVPGAHQDGADLWGLLLAVALIVACIAAVRLIFRHR